ncbi:FxLYD domain-containing protein [Flavobacterium facile]|uniref:FxLYD domain-containing protein n=1 Tax=Flavobacterium facile TaxID=2893174 RepID=UPI002E7A4FD6|nr:FxLYD domain-containing protein [Flavobacterium sp. T-12]
MKVLKWVVIGFVALVLLGLFLPDSDKKATDKKEVTETSKEDIEVVKFSETVNDRMSTVHVEVKNNTDKLLTSGQLKVIYEDKAGNIVGTGLGTILNLAAGATKVVDCLAMDVVGAESYHVEVTPMLYE